MKNPKEMSDKELIRAEFMERFSMWNIPNEKLQTVLDRLPNEEKQKHYLDLQSIVAKDAFKREIDDWLRRVSFTLSIGMHNGTELTEVQREALRIVMLEIKNFEDILQKRAELLSPPKPLRALHSKV